MVLFKFSHKPICSIIGVFGISRLKRPLADLHSKRSVPLMLFQPALQKVHLFRSLKTFPACRSLSLLNMLCRGAYEISIEGKSKLQEIKGTFGFFGTLFLPKVSCKSEVYVRGPKCCVAINWTKK